MAWQGMAEKVIMSKYIKVRDCICLQESPALIQDFIFGDIRNLIRYVVLLAIEFIMIVIFYNRYILVNITTLMLIICLYAICFAQSISNAFVSHNQSISAFFYIINN